VCPRARLKHFRRKDDGVEEPGRCGNISARTLAADALNRGRVSGPVYQYAPRCARATSQRIWWRGRQRDTVSRVWRKVEGATGTRGIPARWPTSRSWRLILDGHCGSCAARTAKPLPSRCSSSSGWRPGRVAPGDQANGRREHRGLAHRARRSRQARPTAARASHRRWRRGA